MSQKFQHVRWIDIQKNGVAKEVLVLNEDKSNGDLYFIPVEHLDDIDKQRVVGILRSRDAQHYPLWEVMAGTTLRNGMNALIFFHQLVKVRTAQGQILAPGRGRGIAPVSLTQALGGDAAQAQAEAAAAPETAKRGPGRPAKGE